MMKKFFTRFLAALALLVFMMPMMAGWGQTRETKTYKLTISPSDFNNTSYVANNNEKTSNAINVNDNTDTYEVKWTSYQVYLNSNAMQWQKSKGYIYNSTNLGTITSVTVTKTAGDFTTYYGDEEEPSSSTTAGGGFFKTKVGSATGTTSKLEVVFQISTAGPTLESLSYTGTPTTTTYEDGDIFDPAGLTVYANYSDESQEDVTANVVWTPNPLTQGTTSVTGTYGGKTVNVSGITVNAAPEPDIVLNASNSPITATTSNSNTATVTLDGIEYESYGGYVYTNSNGSYLSINRALAGGYLGNNTQLCGNIKKIVVDYNTGGASYITMYEGTSALPETTTVTPSTTGTGKVTYTFSGNTGFFKLKQPSALPSNTFVNINSISIYLYDCSVYHVTYNANGATSGNVPTDDTEYDENNNTVTVLGNTGNLAKEHYAFGGWNTAANGSGTHYDVGDQFEISTNTTLYAEWAINKHSYTLNVTGGDHGEVEIYVPDQDGWATDGAIEYGQQVTVSVTPATHYVYSIAVMAGNDPVTVENDMFTMPDSDVTITVTIEPAESFTITFDKGTGICATATMTGYEQDQIPLPIASPSEACALTGWEFAGWATASVTETTNAPALLQGNSSYTITGDATLYAVYKLTEGGSSTSSDVTLSNGVYSSSAGKITWTEDYITIVQEKGSSTTSVADYTTNPRWYKNHVITMSPESTIDSVDIAQNSSYLGLEDSGTSISNGTASIDNNHVARIIPTNGANDIVITMGAQARINGITVYYTGSTTTYNTNPACAMPVPSVTVAETEVEVDANAQEGTIEVTYENLGETILADVEFYQYNGETYTPVASADVETVYPWITVSINNDNNNVEYMVEENTGTASRPAYFRVYALNGAETVYSDYVTITQLTPADTYYEVQLFYALPQTGVIHVKDVNNETVVHAKPGTELYLTFDPYECYTFSSWSVSNISATPAADVTVTDGHFTMPAGRVRVAAATAQSTIYEYLLVVNGVNSDNQSTCTNPLVLPTEVENVPTGFTFAGWTTNENDVEHIITEYTFTNDDPVFFYAVYGHEEGAIPGDFTLVTEDQDDWSGNYLIAYDDETFADGRIGGKDDDGSIGKAGISVKPETNLSNDGTVVNGTWGSKYYVTLEKVSTTSTTYLLKTQDGQYNYQTSNSNGLYSTKTRATAANNPLSISLADNGYTEISIEAGAVFHYNPNQGGFFRFYSSGSQKQVYAYKQGAGTSGTIHYYTRVFFNETATANITIAGPSIVPSGSVLNMGSYTLSNATAANAANFVIEDGGQVKLAEGNTGVYARVQKNITGYGEGNGNWYLVSAPQKEVTVEANPHNGYCEVTNLMPDDITVNEQTVHTYDLYRFDQTKDNYEWQNFRQTIYNWAFYPQRALLYARRESATIEFNVQLADKPVVNDQMTYSDGKTFAGWNLVGNAMMRNQYVGLYQNSSYVSTDYYRMNADGTALELCNNGAPVAPMEGFFVQAPDDNTYPVYLHFSSTPIASKSQAIDINVAFNNAIADRARVRFGEGSMLGKFNFNESATQLYIPQGNKDYAVVRSNGQGEMPVSFKAETSGTYTINVKPENVDVTYLHLIDNFTGANVDLLANPSYSFEANKGDNANRFRLVFKANTDVEDNTATETFAYFNGSEWVINGTGDATLQVIDMMGRVLSSEQINGNTAVNINQAAGVYMLRLVNGENVMVQKVVVR